MHSIVWCPVTHSHLLDNGNTAIAGKDALCRRVESVGRAAEFVESSHTNRSGFAPADAVRGGQNCAFVKDGRRAARNTGHKRKLAESSLLAVEYPPIV